ncbi:MAG: hypothetical protein QXV09_01430 [Candidatus Bathyarchaeia archaeon]
MSICKFCTDKRLNTKVALLYGNRSEKDIVFREELEVLERQNSNLKVVFILNEASDSWKGAIGVIDAGLVKKEVPDYKESLFYACGPPPMIQAMEKLIRDLGLPSTQLKLEVFTGHT